MKEKISSNWTASERRALVCALTYVIEEASKGDDYVTVSECTLCIRMICVRSAENLELNKSAIIECLPVEQQKELFGVGK